MTPSPKLFDNGQRRAQMAYDIWPHLSVLQTITTEELKAVLYRRFTTRQAMDLRRELLRLRRAWTEEAAKDWK